MIIAKRPDRFVELVNQGVQIDNLNVGNMSQTNETRSITNSINVMDEDVENFENYNQQALQSLLKWFQMIKL